MDMRICRTRVFIFCAIGVVAAAPLAVASPRGDGRTAAFCTAQGHYQLSPGLSLLDDTTGTYQGRARMSCTGVVEGHEVSGTGSYVSTGSYAANGIFGGANCATSREASGSFRITLPTTGGHSVSLRGSPNQMTFGPAILDRGRLTTGEPYLGVGAFKPDPGQDCVTTPVTSGTVTLIGQLGEVVMGQ